MCPSRRPSEICLQIALEGVEEEVPSTLCSYKDRLTIVREFELGPPLDEMLRVDAAALLDDINGRKRRLVVVSHIVQQNRATARACDGKDSARGVVRSEVRRPKEKLALPILRLCIPKADGVVL